MINKLDFLLGNWKMIYNIPKSSFGEASTSVGTGIFKRALNDKYVYFDYSSAIESDTDEAHAIFAWDEKAKLFRLWWFENSGNFSIATGEFINEETLFLN
ncbi:hypothetical protein [Saccharicrinis sp. GN24d3]|uniref:hypothetical protein n=1 Tax=Saccharicrinis sp. GN24d3 TaxID=3458416 RepID=UPI0040355466